MVVEVTIGVHGVPPLPMGIRRVDRHVGAGLMTLNGVQGTIKVLDLGSARLLERRNLR